jgi:hypothetical protein
MLILVPFKPALLVLGLLSGLIFVGFIGSSLLEGREPFAMNRSEARHRVVMQDPANLEPKRPQKALQRKPSSTLCGRKEEASQSHDPKSISLDKLRTASGLGSDDAYRELHSVKVLMSCKTARIRKSLLYVPEPAAQVPADDEPISLHFTQLLRDH